MDDLKIEKIPIACSECGRVIVGEADERNGRELCGKCFDFYSRWLERKPEQKEEPT